MKENDMKIRLQIGKGVLALALGAIALLGACDKPKSSNSLGLIVTSIDNPYFVEMIQGARTAAESEPALPLEVQAPERGAVDPERQQQLAETLIARKTSVLLIVPADSTQIIATIQAANRSKIPVVILDNDINETVAAERGATIAAFIGCDNIAGGKLAGDFIKQRLGDDGGEVAILEGVAGVQAAVDRNSGFVQSVGQQASIQIVASQAADWDREKAYNVTRAILVAHPKLKALFGSNDEMALGAARAINEAGRKDIVIVGYDATPDGRQAVSNGILAATIAQQPKLEGQLGVEFARRLLKGETIPTRIDVPLEIITRSSTHH